MLHALEKKIPPPLVMLLFALLMGWLASNSVTMELNIIARMICSVVLLAVGLVCCIAGIVSFRQAKTTVNPLKPELATELVSSGIYTISRNPMYLGFALFLLSFAVYLASPLAIMAVVGFVLYMNRFQIKPEERALEKIFGVAFTDYQARVRRWL
jgi:protein-S-isoprenylcysteine O-methyltransferase Ste14